MTLRSALLLCSIFCLGACTVGPDYKAPELSLPSFWHSASNDTPPAQDTTLKEGEAPWWQSLHDQKLNDLITRALAQNENLKVAQARILEARGARQTARSGLFPQVGVEGEANRADEGLQTFNGKETTYQADFDASWEIDIFGGTRRQVQAETANIGVQEANYRNVRLTLAAEVAREYVNYRELQEQLNLTIKTSEAQQKLLDITRTQMQNGTVSTLDVSQSSTLYKNTNARVPDFERQLAASGYRLSVLLGETPGVLNDELKDIAPLPVPDHIPVLAAPADVIARRPDIQQAEHTLAMATALHAVAISEIYPKITLSALFGIQHATLPTLDLTSSGAIWSVGSGIAAPLINFGKIEGDIHAADARQEQALHAYKQTVLEALGDVETDLSNLNHENERRLALRDAAVDADHSVNMARLRYKDGLSDFADVLSSEQQSYSIKIDLAASEAAYVQDVIALYKALGMPVPQEHKE